jgi:hypothetical protein
MLLMLQLPSFTQKAFEPNYDESKVPSYTLPDVLKTNNNVIVKNKTQWEKERSPEIVKLFEDNVYGQMPRDFDSLTFIVTNQDDRAMDGKATLKEITISVFRNRQSVAIRLILFVPTRSTQSAAAFVLINNRGKENTDPAREIKSDFWPAEMMIDSGYAIGAFHVSDLAPDNKDSFMHGVLRLYPEQLQAKNGMRAIGAWAWGASRVMDYFEQDETIDAKKVAIVGHSRGGKAALWASAQDQRFALCISNNPGNTGAALSRRKFGETVAVINTAFPHWFTPNYRKYNSNVNALPVDQHMLIALSAPRPLYATSASKDLWADPKGTFLSLKNAEKVYALYGIHSKLPDNPPDINTPIINSPLAYHNREGIHNLTAYDWKHFIMFATLHLDPCPRNSRSK